jgi:hypothetical protein
MNVSWLAVAESSPAVLGRPSDDRWTVVGRLPVGARNRRTRPESTPRGR